MKRQKIAGILGTMLVAIAVQSAPAAAQGWPNRPVTLVQPYSAGGGMDPVGRLVGTALTEKYGQNVLMEYRAGAAGTIGTAFVAKAPPDGYTLLIDPSGPLINAKYLMSNIGYDAFRDFVHITKVAETSGVIITNSKKLPMKTLKEFVEYAKANPDSVTAANVGLGSGTHLAALLLEKQAGIKLRHVPYKGTGQMMADLAGGQVDMTINFFAGFGPLVDNGTLNILAVTGKENIPEALKKYPTVVQAGFPGVIINGWYGLYAPAGTPKDITDKIRVGVTDYFKTPAVAKAIVDLGYVVSTGTSEELTAYMKQEDVKWGAIIKETGVKAE
jgi:tripartite-type tricarboxylate transporter receptor subunit TctC